MTPFRTERVLARTFFSRFFESDVMPAVPQVQLVIWSVAVLAAPGFMMALQLGRAYSRASNFYRANLLESVLRDQLLYVTYSMFALGFVALVMWEGVFPDRRDARILDVLPISTRTHVAGRIAGLGAFAALFSIGANLPSAVAYGLVLFVYEAAAGPLRIVAAHLIVTAMAGWFAFFLLILAQGVLLNVFGRTIARRLALVLQAVFVIVLLQALIFVPWLGSVVGAAFRSGESTRLSGATLLPPAWFLALYDVLAGTRRPLHGTVALAAVVATASVVVLAAGLIASSYRRLVRIALESSNGGDGRTKLFGRFSRALAGVLRPGPVQRAVAGFTLRSLGRSRTHLMLLATYVGAAAALVVSTLIPLVVSGKPDAFQTPSVTLLSAPLVLYFFTLVGMRALFGIPIEIKANWLFRLHAPEDRRDAAVAGARLALLLAVVAPIAIAAGILGVTFWGAGAGAIHLGATAALGVLLLDLLLVGLRKIPFACTYYPGRSRAPTLWPLFVAGFIVYAYELADTESAAMTNRPLLGAFLVSIAVAIAGLAHLRRFNLQRPPGLVYEEEEPGRMFEGFKLSEGLAAERPATVTSAGGSSWPR